MMKNLFRYIFFSIFLFAIQNNLFSITVDLQNPKFTDGVLETLEGGIVCDEDLRIQARVIRYVNKEIEGEKFITIEAEGDLVLQYCDFVFVGARVEYDFVSRTGVIFDGRCEVEPWFFGGEEIRLCADGSFMLVNGYATTSEMINPNWSIQIQQATLREYRYMNAKNVQFKLFGVPALSLPGFQLDLETIFDSPIQYIVRLGGKKGPRFGIIYEVFSWRRWQTFLRVDYRTKRGWGGGIETNYQSNDGAEKFYTINYAARDTSISDPSEKTRYMFQGMYQNLIDYGRTSIFLSYDKLSDENMETDYLDEGLRIRKAKRTQLLVRQQRDYYIANFVTRLRINDFQTVKQELPTLEDSLHPFTIGNTGIISNQYVRGSYLDFEYRSGEPGSKDYSSSRFEWRSSLYRPLNLGALSATPSVGHTIIHYGKNREGMERWLVTGLFGIDINSHLYRYYGNCKHVISPYVTYNYYTWPTTPPDDHFIFDIEDGWFRLNQLQIGINHNFYTKRCDNCVYRALFLDLYTNTFFDTKTIPNILYKCYADLVYSVTPRFKATINTAWDFEDHILDHINYRIDWTLSSKAAFSLEYRHRSKYAWRKVDYTNFMLDSFRSREELLNSGVSDKRDTMLLHLFYRFHPNWAITYEQRQGWNRNRDRKYNEFEVNFLGRIERAWNLSLGYRHRENDDRFLINFTLDLIRPVLPDCPTPCLEF